MFETLLLIYLFQPPPIVPVVDHLAGHSAVDSDVLAGDDGNSVVENHVVRVLSHLLILFTPSWRSAPRR